MSYFAMLILLSAVCQTFLDLISIRTFFKAAMVLKNVEQEDLLAF